MRVAIAGSSGFLGQSLVHRLRAAGHEVRLLVRHRPRTVDERGWDPPSGRIDQDALHGVHAVINFCGAGIGDRRWSAARKQELRDSRLTPTEVLAGAVADHGIPTMINASAVGFYGDTGDHEVDETAGAGRGFLAELCRDWEAATHTAAKAGTRVVRIRSGLVLSRSGGLLGKLRPLFWAGLGGRLGSGEQYMPWISLEDEIAAIQFLLEAEPISGPVNLTAPHPVTNAEFTRALGAAVNRPTLFTAPGFALRLLTGEFADEGLLAGQRAIPGVLTEHGFRFRHRELAAALSEMEPS
ncbi:TIGR01777 family protein [Pseudonocardiaceae bacterium YIM PH 21723]|nr:TIGR01777 family protein [Pseudonocardiaceae bacterium YIM PH 21723]